MTPQALLVSKDDQASEALARVLAGYGVAVERSSEPEIALTRLSEQRYDEVIVDFDEPEFATRVLENIRQLASGTPVITVALIADESKIRHTFGAGANFVILKPVSEEKAAASLKAATALLKRERRRSFRVPVQAAVTLSIPGGQELEGIMLDLSESGMDVLAAQPLFPSALVGFRFSLPDGSAELEAHGEVAWANPNGQSGVRFIDLSEGKQEELRKWLSSNSAPDEAEPVSQCKLTDLSLGGCYVETESPFPEHALVDLCLKAGDLEIHAEGLVRVMHPDNGMGIEFPSRTAEQRAKVGDFIEFLTSRPGTMPELLISPKKLAADESEFTNGSSENDGEDALLELLRTGQTMEREQFVEELRKQRNSEPIASS
ncbi:MAG TPA: PilZ domain-containing protein [Terriglobales bacterium]|nr:PilZ domain-containing protein [Terriglobales bacterium]